MRQMLLTPALIRKLPPLGTTANEADTTKIMAQCKFFTPWTSWTWWVIEYDGGDTFFGLVQGFEKELGFFRLSELLSVAGPFGLYIERDELFEATPLSELL